MDNVRIEGIRNVDFVSPKDGKQIKGKSLYISYREDDVEGRVTDRIFVSSTGSMKVPLGLSVGSSISILYNRRGKVADISLIHSQSRQTASAPTPAASGLSSDSPVADSSVSAAIGKVVGEAISEAAGKALNKF